MVWVCGYVVWIGAGVCVGVSVGGVVVSRCGLCGVDGGGWVYAFWGGVSGCVRRRDLPWQIVCGACACGCGMWVWVWVWCGCGVGVDECGCGAVSVGGMRVWVWV